MRISKYLETITCIIYEQFYIVSTSRQGQLSRKESDIYSGDTSSNIGWKPRYNG
jgi:hypothetical protein